MLHGGKWQLAIGRRSLFLHYWLSICVVSLSIIFGGTAPAAALTVEQAREQCRESVGRPFIMSCMARRPAGAGREIALEACRAQVFPQVRACVMRTMGAANGRPNLTEGLARMPQVSAPVIRKGEKLSMDQAIARCRESVGRPLVMSCMRSQRGQGSVEGCKKQAYPQVKACVMNAMNTANGRPNVAMALPTAPLQDKDASGNTKEPSEGAAIRFAPPPRSISDITAILDSEKPDLKRIAEVIRKADTQPPSAGTAEQLGRFYSDRSEARADLGRHFDAISDVEKALHYAQQMSDVNLKGIIRHFAAGLYSAAGDPKKALSITEQLIRDAPGQGSRGLQFRGNLRSTQLYIQLGQLAQAEAHLRRNVTLIEESRTSGLAPWRAAYGQLGQWWEGNIEAHRAAILEARGQLREAEVAYRQSELRYLAGLPGMQKWPDSSSLSLLQKTIDLVVLDQARIKTKQGRLIEAEIDLRRALLSQLKSMGQFNVYSANFIVAFAQVLVDQGRYVDAEALVVIALNIYGTIGVSESSQVNGQALSMLGGILNLQRKHALASEVYAALDRAITSWEPQRRESLELTSARIHSLFAANNVEAGIAAAQALLKREIGRVGEKHFDTAVARGTLAIGYMRAGKDADALREFRAAIPVLLTASREIAIDDDSAVVAARTERLKDVVEAYIGLLARSRDGASAEVAAETFRLSDAIRGQSVQRALTASTARMVAREAALAELVRKEQDLEKQIGAQLGLLNNVLSLPSGQRDEKIVPQINADIERLRASRASARTEIARRFPSYAELTEPKAPTVDEARAALRSGEALVSFYFGREQSFVWVVPKEGPAAFSVIAASGADFESKIATLRKALEPDVESINRIPAFDLALASDLYEQLLKPVEGSWKQAKSLVVVTNGALGLLPLGLLPTSRVELKADAEPWFAAYRDVPWLARTHAVTLVPSAAALKTLRQLPAGSASREALIGFGNPFFSEEQAAAALQLASAPAEMQLRRRALPKTDQIDSAELAKLPRLPDTSDELKAVAAALGVDAAKSLHLGKAANETTVKGADLARYRIVAFATHGLLPGDLNGLSQPALALTAPKVAGIEGDGLLTMEEILALRLDADWVVLSACNTGAGTSTSAEALSGLGRAFFYAGTRSLLITNWSVDSVSARELVTNLFRRQAADPKLSRAEALRQAMMALVDAGGHSQDGKMLYSYAHPLFWAPYSVIGEGGGLQ